MAEGLEWDELQGPSNPKYFVLLLCGSVVLRRSIGVTFLQQNMAGRQFFPFTFAHSINRFLLS